MRAKPTRSAKCAAAGWPRIQPKATRKRGNVPLMGSAGWASATRPLSWRGDRCAGTGAFVQETTKHGQAKEIGARDRLREVGRERSREKGARVLREQKDGRLEAHSQRGKTETNDTDAQRMGKTLEEATLEGMYARGQRGEAWQKWVKGRRPARAA
ncbi:hypothetical protein ERJ75_000375700 [Trypanosoma vivax]|nr:hypothetical protein ERJ75_000375700 [Trypanosoma vivax]